ncbi:Hypp6170 [Branchiostoma lanceolatum]|uniref:Hypp6170 protein n=1 Tax=Branchiostoma lanceolatum TaxID=7740 RepID=A0A8J9VK10_BRALA|nr:Hypp6170 [Branchiostoma lanceolatum]
MTEMTPSETALWKGASTARERRTRPHSSSRLYGDEDSSDNERSPSRTRQVQEKGQAKMSQQDTPSTYYKAAVSKRAVTVKRTDRRVHPYSSSWLSGDEESSDDERSPCRD